jgi:hypothetical protein
MRKFHCQTSPFQRKKKFLFSGANLTHVVVLKPKQSGISNSSHAIITYQKSEKNSDVQVKKNTFTSK